MVTRNAAAINYAVTIRAAAVEQIQVIPLPPSVAVEIRELVAWVGQLQRQGLLDAVPPGL